MAIRRPNDHRGCCSRASAGIRQFSFSEDDIAGTGERLRKIKKAATTTATPTIELSTITRVDALSDGNIVSMTRINDSSRSTLTIKVATTFNHGLLTHGPRTSRSLQSNTRKTDALGSRMPARAWTATVIRPSG